MFLVVWGLAAACTGTAPPAEKPAATTPEPPEPDTDALLEEFYAEHGGREAFPEPAPTALEALLHAEDDVDAGDLASARTRVEDVYTAWPHEDDAWYEVPPEGVRPELLWRPVKAGRWFPKGTVHPMLGTGAELQSFYSSGHPPVARVAWVGELGVDVDVAERWSVGLVLEPGFAPTPLIGFGMAARLGVVHAL